MVCPYLEDSFELFLLGTLSADEAASVSEHLGTGCATCQERLREAVLTVYFLCQPGRAGRLESKAKASLLCRLQSH